MSRGTEHWDSKLEDERRDPKVARFLTENGANPNQILHPSDRDREGATMKTAAEVLRHYFGHDFAKHLLTSSPQRVKGSRELVRKNFMGGHGSTQSMWQMFRFVVPVPSKLRVSLSLKVRTNSVIRASIGPNEETPVDEPQLENQSTRNGRCKITNTAVKWQRRVFGRRMSPPMPGTQNHVP